MLLKKFISKDGKEIVLRTFSKNDVNRAKEFCNFINSIIKERDYITKDKKVTMKEESEWLKRKWKEIQKGNLVFVIAEHNNKLVGISGVRRKNGVMKHIGEVGIFVIKEYREKGIGKQLIRVTLELAKKKLKGLKCFRLSVFETNKRAINLYKKFGFKKVAKIPKQFKRRNKYIDEIIMLKFIK